MEKYGKGIIEEKEINGYSKLIKKPLEQLTEEEFDYMRKVLKVRLNYIRENTPEGTSFWQNGIYGRIFVFQN